MSNNQEKEYGELRLKTPTQDEFDYVNKLRKKAKRSIPAQLAIIIAEHRKLSRRTHSIEVTTHYKNGRSLTSRTIGSPARKAKNKLK